MPPRQASRFASRTAFEALAPSEDESSASDVEETQELSLSAAAAASASSGTSTPARLTRTQQKKLAKEARLAKKASKANVKPAADGSGGSGGSASASTDSIADAELQQQQEQPAAPVEREEVATAPASQVEPTPAPAPLVETINGPVAPANKAALAAQEASSVAASPSPASKAPAPALAPAPAPAATKPATALDKLAASATADEDKTAAERAAYWKKIRERTTFTFLMIGGFIGLLLLGHPYMIILVLIIQVLVYREVTALFEIPGRPSITGGAPRRGPLSRQSSSTAVPTLGGDDDDDDERREEERKELVWSKTLSWYFFTVANFFLYGESLIYYFKHIVFIDSYFIPFARHHRFLSFLLYIIGFVGFVSGLRRENLKHQFGLFGWVHMSLLLIVFSSHFLVNNILEGLIWFFLPASLVICNDVFAYVCGMIWGRTPLISLSPKKTVEGFVGAFIITEVFAYGWATLFQRFSYMICPAVSLGMNAFQEVQCVPNGVFEWHALPLPASLSALLGSTLHLPLTSIPYTEFQLHSLVMASFASLVAPFGGFFASGFKRAFNIKDFGDSIPGHGGLTDRFDCQFLMGLFSYVYYSSLIREHHVGVGSVLQLVVTHLSQEEQVEVYREIGRFLASKGATL